MKRLVRLKTLLLKAGDAKSILIPAGISIAMQVLLSACLSVAPTPTRTPTITPSATPTQSFPTPAPTITNTPQPTTTPTLDRAAGLGEILYQTTFDENDGWSLGPGPFGAVSLFEGKLVISVNTSGTTIISDSPAPVFTNFNVEVKTESNICTDADEYGLVFRKTSESDHYRFTITCEGGARFSRVVDGVEVGLIPISETFSVFPGAPAENNLAVKVEGNQFQFFINEILVFEAKDPVIQAGGIGLIVRSRKGGQTTIAFDDLLVREIAPTITPSPNASSP